MNQIQVGLNGAGGSQGYGQDPAADLDSESAVDGFRYNLVSGGPIYPKDNATVFYKSNVFYAPFDPYRAIYIHTSWQANDPFVHFLPTDLINPVLAETNRVDFLTDNPLLSNLGRLNTRYRAWGGNPSGPQSVTDYQIAIKDPFVVRPDDWNFPTNQALGIASLGQVHRGTPWQTVFLKSTNILAQTTNPGVNLLNWATWTGDTVLYPSEPYNPGALVPDALFTAPTNDWHLVSTLNVLFNTNAPQQLASVNQATPESWEALLDGLVVLINNKAPPQTMHSNSAQAGVIAQAILQSRAQQPNQVFRDVGSILTTPELSISSPWLAFTDAGILTDEVLEKIPSQLLQLLRADSIATATLNATAPAIQFSGLDGYRYAIQVSTNLFDWVPIATNTPVNGAFTLSPGSSNGSAQFYRSALVP
jgi:hypothetical protein